MSELTDALIKMVPDLEAEFTSLRNECMQLRIRIQHPLTLDEARDKRLPLLYCHQALRLENLRAILNAVRALKSTEEHPDPLIADLLKED